MTTRIITGDCMGILASLPADSVHMCVTSPPYFGLRDYGIPPTIWGGDPVFNVACEHEWGEKQPLHNGSGLHRMPPNQTGGDKDYSTIAQNRGAFCLHCNAWRGAFGLEPTIELFVEHAVEVFRAVWRVLRPDGTLWLNLGDTYHGGGGGNYGDSKSTRTHAEHLTNVRNRVSLSGLKPKDLCGIPWHVAFALQADRWYLRQDIIWAKPNPMPESVTDRSTKAHEYLFLLSKSANYFYDAEAIKEDASGRIPGNVHPQKGADDLRSAPSER